MEDKNNNPGIVNSDDGVVRPPDYALGGQLGQSVSPDALSSVGPTPLSQRAQPAKTSFSSKFGGLLSRIVKRADVVLAVLLVLSMVGVLVATSDDKKQAVNPSVNTQFETQDIPLSDFKVDGEGVSIGANSVVINGAITLNGGFVVTPSLQPSEPEAGQLYFDQDTGQLAYYNGTNFVILGNQGEVVESLGGLSGQIGLGGGLAAVGNQLVNAGVLSLGGQGGAIVLGSGLGMSGSALQNTGVLNVIAGTDISVTNDGNGNFTVSNIGAGSGTVASSGGTAGAIPLFTAAQNIEDSIVTQSGLTVTITGDLSVVTGGLSLSNALTVSNGGTGATSLAANGVIVGNGTSALTSVAAGGAGLCLLSTVGAPAWGACPGGSGVSSLNGLTGALNVANASAAGSTITIDDATTVSKGIASFNSTNFSVAGGAVNTIQNINTVATPTFAGLNTNSITPSAALTVGAASQILTLQGNGGTTITATSGANTTTLGFTAPTANVTINVPALSAGTYDLCTTSGNCLGGAGGGANTALSNLTGVAINTTLLPGAAGAVNLGSATLPFGDVFLAGTSGTPGTNNFRITGASTGGTRTITLPDATGTVCLDTGNCAGAGGGVTTSGGTIGTLPVFTGAQAIGDSLLSQSGGVVTVAGHLNLTTGNQYRINGAQISSADLSNDSNLAKLNASQTFTGNTVAFQNALNSTNAFNIQNAAGTRVLTVDTSNGEVELGIGSMLDGKLVFSNVSNANTVTIAPGTPSVSRTITLPDDDGVICLDSGNCAGAGATLQTAYNFSVGGTTPKIKVNSTLLGVDIQDADTTIGANLFNVRASNGAGLGQVLFGVGNTGNTTIQTSTNSATAFRLLTDGGTTVLVGDTQSGQVILGQGGTLAGSLLFHNATNSNAGTIQTAVLGQNTTFTLPDPSAASATICLNTGNCLGGAGGGANTALSNLAGVAINTTLLPGAAGTISLGSGTLPFGDLYLAGSSVTPGTNNFQITGTSTGGTRVITLPDATGTVCLQGSTSCGFAPSSGSANYVQNQIASDQTADFRISGDGRAANLTGTTGINTGAGAGTQRIDSGGNLVNIGNLTASGAITIASTGAGNDVTVDGADQFIVQDAAVFNGTSVFNTDADFTFADTENMAIINTVTGTNALDLIAATLTNQTTSGTQRGLVIANADDAANATTEALIVLDNAETTASTLTDGILITSSGVSGGIVDAIDVSDANITNAINIGTNFLVASGDSINDFTGDGLNVSGNALGIRLDTTAADGSTTSSVSGLEIVGGELSLIRGCAAGGILEWDNINFEWDCGVDDGGAGSTPDFDEVYAQSITNGNLTMEIDDAGGLIYNLTSTGDFIIQDNGTAFVTFSDTSAFTVQGAVAASQTAGVDHSITGGTGGSSATSTAAGAGGLVTLSGGTGGNNSSSGAGGTGGALMLLGGTGGTTQTGTAGAGGAVTISAGTGGTENGGTAGAGGVLTLSGGNAGTTAFSSGNAGGAVNITGGAGSGTGIAGTGGNGGTINLTAGAGGIGTTDGDGGNLVLTAGTGGGSGSGGDGGAVRLIAGAAGTGNAGYVSVEVTSGTSAFRVINGSITYFDVNTSSNQVRIGSAGAGTTAFVLDSGTADLSNVAGSMYYNTTSGKFRCYQGGWTDCIGAGGGTPDFDEVYAQSITNGNLTMEIDDTSGLTFNMTTTGGFTVQDNGTKALMVQDNGLVAVGNVTATAKLHVLGANGSSSAGTSGITVVAGNGGGATFVGGANSFITGSGGASTSASSGGNGGATTILTGGGGAVSGGSGTGTGGAGGAITLTTGNGGDSSQGNGGAGGNIVLSAGDGGASSIGIAGTGGSIVLSPGAGGATFGSEGSVYIGDIIADSTGYLLVLDNKNTSGDPLFTGTDGAMYYNSNSGRFRCYENGAWKECTHRTVVRLASDQTNANGSANTMEDVTGLSWSVTSGTMYSFECTIYYTSAATTTGSRWAINGPATTALMYKSEYTLTATTSTVNAMVQAYDSPASSNATSAAGGNLAILKGYVLPSANGTVVVRHASEVASSTITAKAGSNCEWW